MSLVNKTPEQKIKTALKCMEDIGSCFDENSNFDSMIKKMSNAALENLADEISREQFHRKRFTDFVICDRQEAAKPANENRSQGYFTYGEFGGEYGYFKHRKKLTEEEEEWLEEHTECCYYHGQPCWVWQKEESDFWDEDCECRLGREYSSLCVYELDEEEEKRLDIWKQEIIWHLDTEYSGVEKENYSYDNRYYSLEEIKQDALAYCDNPKHRDKISNYDGKINLIAGKINIQTIYDN